MTRTRIRLRSKPPSVDSDIRADGSIRLVRITAGTLLHEVRNPLMSILGEAELILDHTEPHDTEVAGKVRAIRRSARRIQSILERLAAISDPCIKETASGHMIDSGMASPGRFQTVDDTSLAE